MLDLEALYSPENLRLSGATLIDRLARHFETCLDPSTKAWDRVPPADLLAEALQALPAADQLLPSDWQERVGPLMDQILRGRNRINSPKHLGHQVSPPLPIIGLFDSIAMVANQSAAVYEMGPFAAASELAMAATLGGYLGWTAGTFGGIGTHGGSIANLTGLLAARNLRCADSWRSGLGHGAATNTSGSAAGLRPAILVSADAHYSVARAAGILGLGTDQVLKVPVDTRRKLRVSEARDLLRDARARGLSVFAVVGSACSTATGSFDPLEELAELAREHGAWFHVDGSHGASLLLSRRYRDRVKGIERADTVVWDAHKMLYVPPVSTFLFYKEKAHSFQAFEQDAPYLLDPRSIDAREFDGGLRTLECTKRPVSLGLWAAWALFGPQVFENLIDRVIDRTREFHDLLAASDDFAPAHEPECNILCFRHVPARLHGAPRETLSIFQAELRARLVAAGDWFITSTKLDGESVLRVTIMNPHTGRNELTALLAEIRRIGERI